MSKWRILSRRKKTGPKSEQISILPTWFWPVLDKAFWPILGLLIAIALYVGTSSLLRL